MFLNGGMCTLTSLFLYQAIIHQCVLVCARFRSAWPARSCHRETGFGGTFFWLNAAGLVVVSLLWFLPIVVVFKWCYYYCLFSIHWICTCVCLHCLCCALNICKVWFGALQIPTTFIIIIRNIIYIPHSSDGRPWQEGTKLNKQIIEIKL